MEKYLYSQSCLTTEPTDTELRGLAIEASNNTDDADKHPRIQGITRQETAKWITANISQPSGEDGASYAGEMDGFITVQQARRLNEEEKQIWSEALNEANGVMHVLEDFLKDIRKKDPSINLLDPRKVSWKDVLKAINDGKAHYEADMVKGPSGFLRKGFRALGRNAVVFESWLEFVPQGNNYLAPLCASFHVILTVARRIHEVREEIFAALVLIPDDMDFIKDYLDIYQDRVLKESAASLHTSILRVLKHMLIFFNESPFKKVGRSVLKLDRYGATIEGLLQEMKTCKHKFEERTRCALHKRLQGLDGLLGRMGENMARSKKLQRTTVTLARRLTCTEMDELSKGQKHSSMAVLTMNALLETLVENQKRSGDEANRQALLTVKHSDNSLKREDLLEIITDLGFDNTNIQQEIIECLSNFASFSSEDGEILAWIKRASAFQDWAIAPVSRVLLIECDERTTMPVTHLSFLCAEIAHLLSSAEEAVALSYFCGLKCRTVRASDGARDMMVNLVGQMIYQWPEHWDTPQIDEIILEDLKEAKLSALHQTFRSMVSSCPKGSLFYILIDGIENFELPGFRERAMRTIHQLVQECVKAADRNNHIVKFLMTAPNRSQLVADALGPGHVLYVPEVRDCVA